MVTIRVSFPCMAPEETVRYAGQVPSIIPYMGSLRALFEELVTVRRFQAFPDSYDRAKRFVANVQYDVPSISAFLAGGDRREFMKRLAVHEVASVLTEALQFDHPDIGTRLAAKYPDPRLRLDAWFRKTTGLGDLARVRQHPKPAPLRNRDYFDR